MGGRSRHHDGAGLTGNHRGARGRGTLEIKAGLEPGERVAATGVGDLRDGTKIRDLAEVGGVMACFPLSEGGAKKAVLSRTIEELAQLEAQRGAVSDRVGQGVLRALHRIRASYPGIDLAKDAARAARKNLDLVTGAYERGVKSVVDLLDAQNLALTADQRSANAVYDFLVDLTDFQRAVGHFAPFGSPEVQAQWRARMGAYFSRKGVDP